jgi:hypothetical protein
MPPAPVVISGETAEFVISANPDRMIMLVGRLNGNRARNIANAAVREARRIMPKMTGRAAQRLVPVYGYGYFGIIWADAYVYFQEKGIRPFTMFHLAGKTVPMWIDDPSGIEKQRNPKAQTRTTVSGKPQVLIFRRAAQIGQTRTIRTKVAGQWEVRTVPASYPGAPGRIGRREAGVPWTTAGRTGGQIAGGNIGVRWRHPGLAPRGFLNRALTLAAQQGGILPERIYVADRAWRAHF